MCTVHTYVREIHRVNACLVDIRFHLFNLLPKYGSLVLRIWPMHVDIQSICRLHVFILLHIIMLKYSHICWYIQMKMQFQLRMLAQESQVQWCQPKHYVVLKLPTIPHRCNLILIMPNWEKCTISIKTEIKLQYIISILKWFTQKISTRILSVDIFNIAINFCNVCVTCRLVLGAFIGWKNAYTCKQHRSISHFEQ